MPVKVMKPFILIVLIFPPLNEAFWSCLTNGTTNPLDLNLNDVSGTWFEIMRSPESAVPACARLSLLNTTDNANISLQVNYVNNANKKWQPVEENIIFPWNNSTADNTFELKFGTDENKVTATFKVLELYKESYLIVCGGAPSISFISLMKVLSREKQISDSDNQDLLKHLNEKYEVRSSQVGLVYQAEDCNRSVRHLSYHVILTILFNKIFTDILNS